MIVLFLFAFAAFCIVMAVKSSKKMKENNQKKIEMGLTSKQMIETGKYIAGHPKLDNAIQFTAIALNKETFTIYTYPFGNKRAIPKVVAEIATNLIKNIIIEDSSTIEKRVTVGRLLALGVFAFAAKKKTVNELAYLTIQWNDGKYDHDTYFEFEGKGAMQKANSARNHLINATTT